MNNLTWNEKIIENVKKTLNDDESLTGILMDILLIGRESVYRRIRGDVPFAFDEVIKIAHTLGFSIDSLAGIDNDGRSVFELNMLTPKAKIEDYSANLNVYCRLFKEMSQSPTSIARFALNTLPYSFYLAYDNLARFKYFRWLYQAAKGHQEPIKYAGIIIPPKLQEVQKTFAATSKYINKTMMIFDRNIFAAMIFDIEYFYRLYLLTPDDVEQMRSELLDMLSTLEHIAITGQFNTGKEVQIFLANVDIEATYTLFEYDNKGFAHLRLYGVSGMESQSQHLRDVQRDWIDSLRRYSTLISQSGEMERHRFFEEQRAKVNRMGR